MNKLSLHYIAGLIDADGSFSISLSDRRYKGNALTVNPIINLRQLEKYREVLELVQETLGAGRIYKHVDKMLTWQTTNQAETIRVAKKLYPYLHIKKDICRRFIDILMEWNGKKYNKYSSRNKHQLARPIELIEKMMDVAINLNAGQQTKTAYEHKRARVRKLKERIHQFYQTNSKI